MIFTLNQLAGFVTVQIFTERYFRQDFNYKNRSFESIASYFLCVCVCVCFLNPYSARFFKIVWKNASNFAVLVSCARAN